MQVAERVTSHYHSLAVSTLDTVRKSEQALLRLNVKKHAAASPATPAPASGVTDSHKICVQLCLDVQAYASELQAVGVSAAALKAFATLQEAVRPDADLQEAVRPATARVESHGNVTPSHVRLATSLGARPPRPLPSEQRMLCRVAYAVWPQAVAKPPRSLRMLTW